MRRLQAEAVETSIQGLADVRLAAEFGRAAKHDCVEQLLSVEKQPNTRKDIGINIDNERKVIRARVSTIGCQ